MSEGQNWPSLLQNPPALGCWTQLSLYTDRGQKVLLIIHHTPEYAPAKTGEYPREYPSDIPNFQNQDLQKSLEV